MKAFLCNRYGSPDVLELTDLPKPVPARHELLVRVSATTVSSADWRVRSLQLPAGFGLLGPVALGIGRPRQPVLGTELAGEVEAIGAAVVNFKPGDKVVGFTGSRMGCHAEYRCIAADGPVAIQPGNLSDEQAAALCFGGATMLDFYRRAKLRSGERVLVNGASGAVGTAAVQLAKHLGAHVTGVCSTVNLALVRSIGADEVIDYTRDDFARSGQVFDVIVDTAGTAPFSRSARALAHGGRLLLVLATLPELLKAPWAGWTKGKKVIAGPASERPGYVQELATIAAAGHFTPVVDRCYAFEDMRAAHHYVDSGRKRGSVVIRVGGPVHAVTA
ncbi:MAG: NAD(P)-dependent alcohol dehydrogenase [Comamonadaceae bacterium]|nr:MAG: NAD(P)-dependent alcohol dehydrogenase [Comamonadaceae bacterium]